MDERKRTLLRQGLLVFVGLAVLTAVEFGVGLLGATGLLVIAMALIALAKAALVAWFYMHIKHFFTTVTGGDENE